MTTVVNNPSSDTGTGAGLIVGIIVGILVIVALIFYVVPALRGSGTAAPTRNIDVNVALPGGDTGGTSGGNTSGY